MLGDQICPNAYYEPPDMVLGDRPVDERIDWMMAQLQRARFSEAKLEEVTLRLSQKRAALERADRAKDELLSMLAHELRNPLGTISNALQVLRMKGEGDETWKRAIDAAERQVLHQAMLIDDLLEASRVTRGQVELQCEELDLGRARARDRRGVPRVAGGGRPRRSDLDLADEPPLRVRGDRLRLSQALVQPDGQRRQVHRPGRPHHRAGAARPPTAGAPRSASATPAPASPPEELPYVFEVFTQGDHSLDRSQGGLGVGLAVVKGLIELHGGEVRPAARGRARAPSSRFLLPLTAPDGAAEEHQPPAEEADIHPAARRILVVEDNPDAAATLRDFLELSGHEVEPASLRRRRRPGRPRRSIPRWCSATSASPA